jgi:DNA-binding GntR family transcriptional regulator
VRQHGVASEQNLQLHLTIAELAGNQTILQLLKIILVNDGIYNEFSSFAKRSHKDQLIMHSNIVEAINNRDTKAAVESMRIHLEKIGFDVSDD